MKGKKYLKKCKQIFRGNKYLKKCKLKPQDTTIHPLEWQKIKRLLKPSYDQGVEEFKNSHT